jgi:hypothetical protein
MGALVRPWIATVGRSRRVSVAGQHRFRLVLRHALQPPGLLVTVANSTRKAMSA